MLDLEERETTIGPDLTPIIDVVFLLLIFFLVATTFHQSEREMEVALPASSTATPVGLAPREIVVNVDAEGGIVVSGRTLDLEALAALVREATARDPEQKVTVRGHRSCPYERVVAVLDACRTGGVDQPWLDAVPLGGE